ncbi:hypothetical protein LXA43DRAFT_1006440 [Ganoderma leucocontextum]|nr:hypothetical protein LXA43DRAFT_1006440 [Ganoderma leucocontextum]
MFRSKPMHNAVCPGRVTAIKSTSAVIQPLRRSTHVSWIPPSREVTMSLLSLLPLLPKGVSIIEAEHFLIQAVEDTFTVNLAAAAAVTWVAYDITLTFGDEVTLIWRAKWTLQKVIYFFVRYYGLFALIFYFSVNSSTTVPFSVCRGWVYYEAFGAALVTVLFGEGMFLFRLYALYERDKKLLGLIVFLYIAGIITAVTTGIVEGRLIHIMPRPANWPMPGCFTLATVPLTISLGAWILNLVVPSMCFIGLFSTMTFGLEHLSTAIYLLLMVYKLMSGSTFRSEAFARRDPLGELSELRRFSPLIYVLLRDGIFYYVMVFLVNVANLILFVRFNGRALEGMGIAWIMAVYSVASSRLCLNLHIFAVRPATEDEDSESDPSSDPKAIMLSTVVDVTGTASCSFGSSDQTQSTYR